MAWRADPFSPGGQRWVDDSYAAPAAPAAPVSPLAQTLAGPGYAPAVPTVTRWDNASEDMRLPTPQAPSVLARTLGSTTNRAARPDVNMNRTRFWTEERDASGKPTGRINSGLQDGSDPRQFSSLQEMRNYQARISETENNEGGGDQFFSTPEQAIDAVRQFTGNTEYNGYYEGYAPPTPKPGSPMATGQSFKEWNDTRNVDPRTGRPGGVNNRGGLDKEPPPGGNIYGDRGDNPDAPPAPPAPSDPRHGGFGGSYMDLGYFGDQSKTVAPLPTDLKDILTQLMNDSRNQVAQGKEALTGATSDYKDFLGFQRSGAEKNFDRQNYMTNLLTGLGENGKIAENGQYTPGSLGAGISSAIGTMNNATGLSPEAMAALRLQATEAPEQAYRGQVSQLKTQLQGRGAYGGGDTPGALDATIAGYAPLMQNRDTTRSNLLAQAILADEQRKFDSLSLNRGSAASAMNTGVGLSSVVGSTFNPASFLAAGQNSLAGLGGMAGAYSDIGFKGIDTAGGLAGTLNDATGTSFANLLKASLAGAAGKAAGEADWAAIAKGIGGLFGIGDGDPAKTGVQPPPPIPPLDPFPTVRRNPDVGYDPNVVIKN